VTVSTEMADAQAMDASTLCIVCRMRLAPWQAKRGFKPPSIMKPFEAQKRSRSFQNTWRTTLCIIGSWMKLND